MSLVVNGGPEARDAFAEIAVLIGSAGVLAVSGLDLKGRGKIPLTPSVIPL